MPDHHELGMELGTKELCTSKVFARYDAWQQPQAQGVLWVRVSSPRPKTLAPFEKFGNSLR
jgi:hypothetical protein